MNILILAGGISNEKDISKLSASNIADALKPKHNVILVDPATLSFNLNEQVIKNNIDAVFPILHGKGGEDGSIQQQLDQLGVPYLGSDHKACELTFNKVKFIKLIRSNKVLSPDWELVDKPRFLKSEIIKKPFVLKPIDGGSSIDTSIVKSPKTEFSCELSLLDKYHEMLLEEYISGDEVSVGVLGSTPLPLAHIIPPKGQDFDYQNKYNGLSQEIINPKDIDAGLQSKAKDLALLVHNLTGCRHLSRTDMIITRDGKIYVLELNTIPGLTKESIYPREVLAIGYTTEKLANKFVELATGYITV